MDVLFILMLLWVLMTAGSLIILFYIIKGAVHEGLKAWSKEHDQAIRNP